MTEQVKSNTPAGAKPDYGTWTDFAANLQKSFQDPNLARSAYDDLQGIHWKSPADQFFQEFEMHARRCDYLGASTNHRVLLDIVEAKIPSETLTAIYMGKVPTTYETYRDLVINLDTNWRCRRQLKGGERSKGKKGYSSKKKQPYVPPTHHTPDRRTGTGTTYGGRGAPMDTRAQQKTPTSSTACYRCGKEGHFKAQCPDWEKGRQVRQMIAKLTEEDLEDLREDFHKI